MANFSIPFSKAVIFIVFAIGLLLGKEVSTSGKTIYAYEGPEDCSAETCECSTTIKEVTDKLGNIFTKSLRTCSRKYDGNDYYAAFAQAADKAKSMVGGVGKMAVSAASQIKDVDYVGKAKNMAGNVLDKVGEATLEAKSMGGRVWDWITRTFWEYASAITVFFRWELEDSPAKLRAASKLFPPMASQFSHFLANLEPLKPVIDGNNEFGYKLYHALSVSTSGNILVSPLGVSFLMAMLQSGALGETEDALRSIMNFPENELQLAVGYRSISFWLNNANLWDKVTLRMVSGIFIDEKWEVNNMFNGTTEEYFNTNVKAIDFSQMEWATNEVNEFVANATEDQVKGIIYPPFEGTEELVLVNALYFNETWRTPFEKKNTRVMPFYISPMYYVKTPMMNVKGNFLCGEIKELDAKAVLLPYKLTRFSMIMFLPYKRTNLEEMEEKLESVPLSKLSGMLTYHRLNLFVPKFKMESEVDLSGPLKQLGLESIFERDANLSAISYSEDLNTSISVSRVVQRISLEVNENGTMPTNVNDPPERIMSSVLQGVNGYSLFFVGHPFLAVIYDKELSTPIIMLSIKNPSMSLTRMGKCLPSAAPECENNRAKPRGTSQPGGILMITVLLTFNLCHYWCFYL